MGLFSKLASAASFVSPDLAGSLERHATKEVGEALVAIMVGTAWADGELEPGERQKLGQMIVGHPMLRPFRGFQSVLTSKVTELNGMFEIDVDLGLDACLNELRQVGNADPQQKRTIMLAGVASAKADGEGVDGSERAFLARCAEELGVAPREAGL